MLETYTPVSWNHSSRTMYIFLIAFVLMQSADSGAAVRPQSAPTELTTSATLASSEVSRLTMKALAGDVGAQMELARAYESGNGVSQNYELAAQWCRRAADRGDAAAENHFGTMYRGGIGVEKNKQEGVSWYRRAARQGYPAAMFNLGTAYYNGDGVNIDDVLANAWFLSAQKNGSEPANEAVARMATDLPAARVTESYVQLAVMLRKGDEIPRNDGAAAEFYRRAAERGDPSASVELAQQLLIGLGVPQDYSEARLRCEAAARAGFGPGAYCLGLMNRQGMGVSKNPELAAKWFERAAEMHDHRAMLYLAEIYYKGEGVKQNKETAYMWLLMAVNSGVPGASEREQQLRQEMSPKAIEKARRKAIQWIAEHHPLALKHPVGR